jgi:hypothetical protein
LAEHLRDLPFYLLSGTVMLRDRGTSILNCFFCEFWKPIGDDRIPATNGYCRFNAPAAILPYQLSRKDLSERDKFELGERAVPPHAFQPIHPITNSLWSSAQAKRFKTKR